MLKKTFFILSLFCISTLLTSYTKEKKQKALKTIIIDAGHGMRSNGGYDGAKGSYSHEDEICYDISKELVARLKKEFPDVKIIETRPTRNITTLHDRANIANRNNGDLFISIHVNAAPPKQHKVQDGYTTKVSYTGKGKKRRKVTSKVPKYRYYTTPNPAKGTETYIWGAHKSEDKEIALRENAPMLAEENYKNNYGDIDVNSPEFIAMSLVKTKQFFKRSATIAGMVEEQFEKIGRVSRGQKQRQVGIWVLQATAMPSILVETGYITNKAEEDYLNSASGQQELAIGLTNAVHAYVNWLEKQQTVPTVQSNKVQPVIKDAYPFLKQVDEAERKRFAK
jgi:N-acetylmuramoyl-L-alanine amidase